MKVICIDSKSSKPGGWCQLEEGRIYEVSPSTSHCGYPSYDLGGEFLPTRCRCGQLQNSALYNVKKFIPLSDIDETERIDEVIETIFALEHKN